MTDNPYITKLEDIIHNHLIPIQQTFISYRDLSYNPSFHFNKKIFDKCINKCQELIDLARELTEFMKNNGGGEK